MSTEEVPFPKLPAYSGNPKDAYASKKVPFELWPDSATAMGSLGFLEGKLKYGRGNFRAKKVKASVYVAAARRHLAHWMEGENEDPGSKVPHLGSVLACIAIIVDAQMSGSLIDDRQYGDSGNFRKLMESLLGTIEHLEQLHADKTPVQYTRENYSADVDSNAERKEV